MRCSQYVCYLCRMCWLLKRKGLPFLGGPFSRIVCLAAPLGPPNAENPANNDEEYNDDKKNAAAMCHDYPVHTHNLTAATLHQTLNRMPGTVKRLPLVKIAKRSESAICPRLRASYGQNAT